MLRPLRTLSLALFPLGLLLWAACASGTDGDRADLTLYFTGTVNGYIEPCGCVFGQIGGIDRIAGYIEQEMRGDPNALFVETGDFVGEDLDVSEQVKKQLPLKAESFFSAWSGLGCEAVMEAVGTPAALARLCVAPVARSTIEITHVDPLAASTSASGPSSSARAATGLLTPCVFHATRSGTEERRRISSV